MLEQRKQDSENANCEKYAPKWRESHDERYQAKKKQPPFPIGRNDRELQEERPDQIAKRYGRRIPQKSVLAAQRKRIACFTKNVKSRHNDDNGCGCDEGGARDTTATGRCRETPVGCNHQND